MTRARARARVLRLAHGVELSVCVTKDERSPPLGVRPALVGGHHARVRALPGRGARAAPQPLRAPGQPDLVARGGAARAAAGERAGGPALPLVRQARAPAARALRPLPALRPRRLRGRALGDGHVPLLPPGLRPRRVQEGDDQDAARADQRGQGERAAGARPEPAQLRHLPARRPQRAADGRVCGRVLALRPPAALRRPRQAGAHRRTGD